MAKGKEIKTQKVEDVLAQAKESIIYTPQHYAKWQEFEVVLKSLKFSDVYQQKMATPAEYIFLP